MEQKYNRYFFFLKQWAEHIHLNEMPDLLEDLKTYYPEHYEKLLKAVDHKRNEKKLAALLSK